MTSIVVVAHHTRAAQAVDLAAAVSADATLFDDGTLGAAGNHRRAWDWHTDNTTSGWAVVLEDDAIPVTDFAEHLDDALDYAPADIVSLYLGRSRPPHWQGRIAEATDTADRTFAAWILGTHLLHAVAVAARAELAPVMAQWTRYLAEPVDGREVFGHTVAYTWPSLVDHADGPPVADHADRSPRTQPRTAWRTGTPPTSWTGAVPLGAAIRR